MRCMMCNQHATFEHTVFQGTSPIKVKLCNACATKVDAPGQLAKIKAAPDHAAKNAAVTTFLKAVGK
jgi:hypothetical protein